MKNRNEIKKIICACLGWQEVDHQLEVFNTGMEYLQVKIALADRVQQIAETHTWWMWWQRQWENTDRELVNYLRLDEETASHYTDGHRYELLMLYRYEHDPTRMKVYPSSVVKRLINYETIGKFKHNYKR